MFAQLSAARKAALRFLSFLVVLTAAACGPLVVGGTGGGQGPIIEPGAPVRVALLVPSGGSPIAGDDLIATNLENAARLAMADLDGANIDLRVYSTAANPQQAALSAQRAVADGAQIILGPLRADASNAAAVAVAGNNINLLAFSNNPSIAGGNLFVLGPTFNNTANRLVGYARRQGIDRYMVVHGEDVPGRVGRDAIIQAVQGAGATVSGVQGYPLSQEGIQGQVGQIASATQASGAQAIFLTAGVNADLPILATALPERGIDPASVRTIGLTRWNAVPQALSLPGLQGGLFALPDQDRQDRFEARYRAAYGASPHPLAGLAYDGMAAIGALVASNDARALTRGRLTQNAGFQGVNGVFRLRANGTNERALAVATITDGRVVIVDRAPGSFGGAGF